MLVLFQAQSFDTFRLELVVTIAKGRRNWLIKSRKVLRSKSPIKEVIIPKLGILARNRLNMLITSSAKKQFLVFYRIAVTKHLQEDS